MKFSIRLKPDTVAIKATAVYFGVPSQGHPSCYVILTHKNLSGSLEQVTNVEPDIEKKHCIECGKPLIQERQVSEETEASRKAVEYNRAIDERNAISQANREKPWLSGRES